VLSAATFALQLATGIGIFRGLFLDGKWLLFALGVLVYHQLNYAPQKRKRLGLWLLPLSLGSALLYAGYGSRDCFDYSVGLAFAFAIVALWSFDERMARSPWLMPLRVCGTMCYSLYLVHWPVCEVLGQWLYLHGVRGVVPTLCLSVPICVTASLLAAWPFYWLVERHFLNTAADRGRPKTA
jgi:peptidoglycan/LPS O-acetylase OafA/YrhL